MTGNHEMRVHLKVGQAEFSFEGSREHLPSTFFSLMEGFFDKAFSQTGQMMPTASRSSGETDKERISLSTNDIAVRIGAKSTQDLALAAIYKLSDGQPDQHLSRSVILGEMKRATSVFEKKHENGLSSALKALANKSKIRVVEKNVYALASEHAEQLRQKLAD